MLHLKRDRLGRVRVGWAYPVPAILDLAVGELTAGFMSPERAEEHFAAGGQCAIAIARGIDQLPGADATLPSACSQATVSMVRSPLADVQEVSTPSASKRLEHLQDAGLVQAIGGTWQALHARNRNKRAWSKQQHDLVTT